MIEFVSLTSSFLEVNFRIRVGTAVSAILSCENAKQLQGGTLRGKRRYD